MKIDYLGLVLDSKLLFTRHMHAVANKATGVFCNIFPLLFRYSQLTQSNKLTLYKLLIRSIHTYTAPRLQLHILLHLPQTPSYAVKMSPSHR